MATYLQGVSDYISQVQPTQPNLEFDAKILQVKQSQYDAGHKKVNDLYNSLLNSDLSRTDNIQARDEFFKMINTDIKKMSGMDFSLDENVTAATNVFKSVYADKNIVKDMVWTKNFNNQVNRSEALKNCIDPKKCGGQWWETGDKYLQYKKQEFKNASSADAMNMEDVSYVPYNNITGDAMKILKDSGLNVVKDEIKGGYVVTTQNGDLILSPLTTLLNSTIGKDPKFAEMYTAQSYVERNDWVYNKVKTGEFKNVNEAHVEFFKQNAKNTSDKVQAMANQSNIELSQLNNLIAVKEQQIKAGKIIENSDDHKEYINLINLQKNVAYANNKIEDANQAIKNQNNQMGLKVLGDMYDQSAGLLMFQADIDKTASTLAYKDYKITKEADKFALEAQKYKYDVARDAKKQEYEKELIEHEAKYGDGSSNSKNLATATSNYEQAKRDLDSLVTNKRDSIKVRLGAIMKLIPGAETVPVQNLVFDTDGNLVTNKDTDPELINAAKTAYNEIIAKIAKQKTVVNEEAHKANQVPVYPEVISSTLFNAYNPDIKDQLLEKLAMENNTTPLGLYNKIVDPANKGLTLEQIAKKK